MGELYAYELYLKKAVTKTIMWSFLALKGNFIFLLSSKRLSLRKSSFAATRHVRFFAVPGRCSVFPLLNLCLPCPFVWNVFALFKISFSEVHHQCYSSCETSLDEPSWNTFFLVLSQNPLVATPSPECWSDRSLQYCLVQSHHFIEERAQGGRLPISVTQLLEIKISVLSRFLRPRVKWPSHLNEQEGKKSILFLILSS